MKTLSGRSKKFVAWGAIAAVAASIPFLFAQDECKDRPLKTKYVLELRASDTGDWVHLADDTPEAMKKLTDLLNTIDPKGQNGTCVYIKPLRGSQKNGPDFSDIQNSSSIAAKKAADAAGKTTPQADGSIHVTQTETDTIASIHVTQRVASNNAADIKAVLDLLEKDSAPKPKPKP